MTSPTRQTRLLVFDVFGTVVDWRGSIAREAAQLAASRSVRSRTFEYVADDVEDLTGQLGA